jgi:uncharacterized protein (TIGR02145 family)
LPVNTALTNITHTTTIATGIGTASGLPAGVSAAWSANVITISGTPTASGTFNYTIPLTGTSCSAVNATGTITVSAPVCPTATITYNSYTYNTVAIGPQCWMAENLRTRLYNDGTSIPDETANTSGWEFLATGARSEYVAAGVTGYVSNYGYLYNWYAAKGIATAGSTTYKNICPTGWHVPTDSDWNKLVKFIHSGADTSSTSLIQSTTAGGKMKKDDALWTTNTGTNTSGFSALPGGRRNFGGSFDNIRNFAFFWSASEYVSNGAWIRSLSSSSGNVSRSNSLKSVGASVRCLRD